MVIYRNAIKRIFLASLPTIIVPVIVVALILKKFGLTSESLLALIFFGQTYIIWAQLEVALRQTRLSALEYEPEFKIKNNYYLPFSDSPIKVGEDIEDIGFQAIDLTNVGKHSARNVLISLDIGASKSESKFFANIAPNEKVQIYKFEKEDNKILSNSTITINIDYENILGGGGNLTFLKSPRTEFITSKMVRMPGLLLNSFEDLILCGRLFIFLRRRRRIKRKIGNSE